jgi:polysaccharide export outer membrane protein
LRDLLVAKKLLPDPDVTVEVSEYRPFYVTGDVANSGAYPYRPGTTVRDAVAVAGGYDSMHLRSRDRDVRDVLVQALDARAQYDNLSVELVKIEVHAARLQAELSNQTDIDLSHVQMGHVAPELVSELVAIEGQQIKIDRDDFDKERLYLERVIRVTQDQISALSQEEQQERSGLEQQRKDAARGRELLEKSLVPIARVEEQARELSNSLARQLEVKARVSQAQRDLEEFTRKLQKHGDQHKIDIMQQLQKSMGELATVRVRLDTASEKLRYLGEPKQQSLNRSNELRDLVIFRKEHGNSQRIIAAEETSLFPGDTLEITGRTPLDQLTAPVIAGTPRAATGRLAP